MRITETINIYKEGGVARIVLNRPDVYNSFNQEMLFALSDLLEECQNDTDIRAILITGAGKAFCAGQDLTEILEYERQKGQVGFQEVVDNHYRPVIIKIRQLEKPVIAAVNGVAAGAGANLALACDIVVASKSASFVQAFSNIGLVPDSGGTFFLPRLVGWSRASALMMTGEKVLAEDAQKMGMIYAYYDDDQFDVESTALVKKLANKPTQSLALIKKLLNASKTNALEEQLSLEGLYQQTAGQTEDYAEGVSAFLEKRKPSFKGK